MSFLTQAERIQLLQEWKTIIQHGVKKERVRALTMFGDAKFEIFAQDQVGSSSEALFERKNKDGFWEGYTRNYVRVWLDSGADLKNQIRHIYLRDYNDGHLIGELLN